MAHPGTVDATYELVYEAARRARGRIDDPLLYRVRPAVESGR